LCPSGMPAIRPSIAGEPAPTDRDGSHPFEDRKVCIAVGMDDHIGKPALPEALYETLLKRLSNSRARGIEESGRFEVGSPRAARGRHIGARLSSGPARLQATVTSGER